MCKARCNIIILFKLNFNIGYINNIMIKLHISFNSNMCIVEQFIDIITIIQDRGAYKHNNSRITKF